MSFPHFLFFCLFLPEFPGTAINRLKNLTVLALNNYGLTALPEKAFLSYPELKQLALCNSDLGSAIQSGALDYLPPKLTTLGIAGINLKTVPKRMLVNRQLEDMSFSSNRFEAIANDDFHDAINLRSLYLNDNPISKVQNG